MSTPENELSESSWVLERVSDRGAPDLVELNVFPFLIGREGECNLLLQSGTVSKQHARIEREEDGLRIFDLQSTNGTHVNGQRVPKHARLGDRDIVHFGELEFRVRCVPKGSVNLDVPPGSPTTTVPFSDRSIVETRLFLSLLDGEGVVPHFQPIVDFKELKIRGYEVLGRAKLDGLPESPGQLFQIASRLGAEAQLSELFRTYGIQQGSDIPERPLLFVNTHPLELTHTDIVSSLRSFRESFPELYLVLEIHEAAVVDLDMMRRLRSELTDLGIGLAYDDFGAGEGRLNELAEVPPQYLKFDRKLIHNLHLASEGKRRLVESLVNIVHDLGVAALAECIENQEESDACRQIGFDYAQGYFFGKPLPAAKWLSQISS